MKYFMQFRLYYQMKIMILGQIIRVIKSKNKFNHFYQLGLDLINPKL